MAIRVARGDIAFFKYLFESYEGVAIVRTVQTIDRDNIVIAVLATDDFVAEADAILADVERFGSPPFTKVRLPAVCEEDWFLEQWSREADGDE
jgi:hypothetical protein